MTSEDFQQISSIMANLAAVASVIGAFLYFTWRTGKSRQKTLDRMFTSQWVNEGDITAPIPSHYMQIDLKCKDGAITGLLQSSDTQSEDYWENLNVIGVRRGGKAKIEIVDVRRGKLHNYGEARVRLRNDRLYWNLIRGHANLFPKETEL